MSIIPHCAHHTGCKLCRPRSVGVVRAGYLCTRLYTSRPYACVHKLMHMAMHTSTRMSVHKSIPMSVSTSSACDCRSTRVIFSASKIGMYLFNNFEITLSQQLSRPQLTSFATMTSYTVAASKCTKSDSIAVVSSGVGSWRKLQIF